MNIYRTYDNSTTLVFKENEVKANILVSKFLIVCACVIVISWGLNVVGILAISSRYVLTIFPEGIAGFMIPAIVCIAFRGKKVWLKYFMMLMVMIILAYLDSILIFNVPLFIVMPVVFSCWYYSEVFTSFIAIASTIVFAVSAYFGAVFSKNEPDMNFYEGDGSTYVQNIMLQSFMPRWFIFAVLSAVCIIIARLGRKMVLKQNEISTETARVETQLETASRIQSKALPDTRKLDSNPYMKFDLAAKMVPAREVGGDFYDFFYIDETHLALIIADVSDKGIGAALYMMMSKLMLENKLEGCVEPGKVLEEVNNQLCKKSINEMFVTVWLGILDLETGKLTSANAGHEYPAIKRSEGEFEILKDKHGFVLGGMPGLKYSETQTVLKKGDTLFVYTDGVPEANDKHGQFFGEQRMLDSLNSHGDSNVDELIKSIKKDLDEFASEAPQFDDTTMLAIKLH